jgi:hypothetical protein
VKLHTLGIFFICENVTFYSKCNKVEAMADTKILESGPNGIKQVFVITLYPQPDFKRLIKELGLGPQQPSKYQLLQRKFHEPKKLSTTTQKQQGRAAIRPLHKKTNHP